MRALSRAGVTAGGPPVRILGVVDPKDPHRRRVLVAAAMVAIGGIAAALVIGASGEVGEGSRWRPLLVGLCRATEAAEADRRSQARAAFADVHADLHDLVAAAGSEGAGLARQKFGVERDLADAEAPITAELRSLRESVQSTARSLGDDPGSCP